MVAAMCVVMSSCLKNDTPDYIPPVDPADEAPALQAFIDSTGYNLETQSSDYSYFSYNRSTGEIKASTIAAPYLYYEIVEPGDMSAGSVQVPITDLGGTGDKDVTVHNTYSDSTLGVWATYKGTLLDGTTFDETESGKSATFFLPVTIAAWQLLIGKVGKGGHIRILTPSAYGYSNQKMQGIPANSPLYFDITVKGFIENKEFGVNN